MKDFKYYILTLIGLLCPLMTMAEETDLGVPKVWTVPAVFTAITLLRLLNWNTWETTSIVRR